MDRLQFGLATFHRPGMDVWSWVELARKLALGGVELRADPGIAHPDDFSPQDLCRLRHLSGDGLRVSLHMPIHGVNLTWPVRSVAAASLGEVARTIDLAAEINADVVVIHPGKIPEEYASFPQWLVRSRELLRFALAVLLKKAEKAGVRLALENLGGTRDRGLVQTAEEHLALLQEFPELWACFDLGHLHTLGGSPKDYIKSISHRLIHVHLHDNLGDWDAHLSLGEGNAPWVETLQTLEELGFSGRIILEIPDPQKLTESLKKVCPG
ncbi:MAG: sugar phosphate isomerase/epimerase [Candidatus Bipolaricaulota bacterium]|nr:sugar phosphate isomerase/epimerase [Candidatus Bipolaricaulota bacterium]MDW8126553.1 sugar phosphate isomerase/epimerase family protein [Candidatus Bipolaricaulota bacterium]